MLGDRKLLTVLVELTPAERALMVKYGHPLSQTESALRAVATSRATETLELYTFELDRLIADICYFVDEEEVSTRVRNQAYELCARLDHACQTGDGLLDF